MIQEEILKASVAYNEEHGKIRVIGGDALWCCRQAASIAKNENDMGNAWYAENWLKGLKERIR